MSSKFPKIHKNSLDFTQSICVILKKLLALQNTA